MKNLYVILLSCIALALPKMAASQCACGGGAAPDSVVHNYTLSVNSSPSITISFPRFDPALGTLSCLVYRDTLSAVSTTHVRNHDSADQEYAFRLTVNNQITAPGLSVNAYMDKYYGPDSLKAYGKGLDSIKYGPDTTFDRVTHMVTKSSGLSPFMGSGSVSFVYGISGGLISMAGGLNFSQNIETSRWGSFKLTYFYCPNSILASNIKNLSVNKNDRGVIVTWTTSNEFNTYEIEISTDGKNFTSAGESKQAAASGSTSTKHEYQHHTDQALTGTVYYRVKETDPEGKVSYSEIRTVSVDKSGIENTLYPNPAANGVNVLLDRSVQGEVEVSLVNAVGQTLFSKMYRLENTNNINVQWSSAIQPGVYYLKVKDLQTQVQKISKLFIK
jgi:hypothetical protein